MKWLEKLGLSRRPPVRPLHPPWCAGQYVTYWLERDDGSWVAFELRVFAPNDEGIWPIVARFKTPSGEAAVLFRADPGAPDDAIDPVPAGGKVTRQSPSSVARSDDESPEFLRDEPMALATIAMNLLTVRRSQSAAASLAGDPRLVDYPCGIDRAHLFVSPGLGYEKHHDLCPRVLVTGVAGMSIDGSRNPIIVTSFGYSDPAAEQTAYDDFIDVSHLQPVVHDGFALTYPATWFFTCETGTDENHGEVRVYQAQLGGVSCSLLYSVSLHSGTRDHITEVRDGAVARLSGPQPRLARRDASPLQLPDGACCIAFDMVTPGVDGMSYAVVVSSSDGERLAQIIATGCVATANPRRVELLAAYEQVFRTSLESFRLL